MFTNIKIKMRLAKASRNYKKETKSYNTYRKLNEARTKGNHIPLFEKINDLRRDIGFIEK